MTEDRIYDLRFIRAFISIDDAGIEEFNREYHKIKDLIDSLRYESEKYDELKQEFSSLAAYEASLNYDIFKTLQILKNSCLRLNGAKAGMRLKKTPLPSAIEETIEKISRKYLI